MRSARSAAAFWWLDGISNGHVNLDAKRSAMDQVAELFEEKPDD